MATKLKSQLNSSEIGKLWVSFLNEKVIERFLQVFLHHCEDKNSRTVLETAFKFSHRNQKWLSELFQHEELTPPYGFTEQDINLDAPRLFSDAFYLYYLVFVAKAGLIENGFALVVCTRNDVIDYYEETIRQSEYIYRMSKEVLIKQGMPIEAPIVPLSNNVQMASYQNYLGRWIGSKRASNSLEITELFASFINSTVIQQLLTGFCKLDIQSELCEYLTKGKDLAEKHQNLFQLTMDQEKVPVLRIGEFTPFVKNEWSPSPFSEKLMMVHTMVLSSFLFINYGFSKSVSLRRDLSIKMGKSMSELENFLSDGTQLLIRKGWLEESPQMIKSND